MIFLVEEMVEFFVYIYFGLLMFMVLVKFVDRGFLFARFYDVERCFVLFCGGLFVRKFRFIIVGFGVELFFFLVI